MTKADKLRMHFRNHGDITSMEAFRLYGITRLAAQVFSLKRQGMPIETEIEETKDEDGRTTKYARYFLTGE